MEIIAQIKDVSKQFGKIEALNSLSLEVKRGEAVALLGPNGAGKSTALSILVGLRQPSSGSVSLFGNPAGSAKAMSKIGVTPQVADFPDQITPREILQLAAAHFENPRPIDELINTFQLEKLANRQMRGFSGGERRKLALALSFIGNPKLIILDEPTSGLDAAGQKHFQQIAKDFVKQGGSLLLTSHYWQEIENIANRITMIDAGKTILSGVVSDIKAAVGLARISFSIKSPTKFVKENFQQQNNRYSMVSKDTDATIRQLVKQNELFTDLSIVPLALDEALEIYQKQNERN